MKLSRTIVGARESLAHLPRPLGLVPTMGALHAGHLALVSAARDRCAAVAASIFVNPTQFGAGEDFDQYPRNEERDLKVLAAAGVDLVFAPPPAEMYRPGAATTVNVSGPLTETLEGALRPDHLDGVATIVTKLLTIVAPDVAFFGEKDAQQLAVIRRFVADLDLPVEIVGVPTVREPDGLAMSSRNARLSDGERSAAANLYRALLAGQAAAAGAAQPGTGAPAQPGDTAPAQPAAPVTPATVITSVTAALAAEPRFAVEYVAVVDRDTFEQQQTLDARSLIVVAARLGTTRLIDNLPALPSSAPAEGVRHSTSEVEK
jgi:pantoate--beta-alanine ligase